jgi:secreted trypsin-like serine protease
VLNQNNDFIGSCAVIPNTGENRNDQGTRKVITAAHKLKNVNEGDLLKVRVGEWDASGFKAPEVVSHQEYLVTRAVPHPLFNPVRLSNDIAVLVLERDLDLTDPYINSVCLPSCDQQFDHVFTNGSGSRCWVAGWGKDEFTGSFQFLQRKVNVPLVGRQGCEHSLRAALDRREAGQGQRFSLDPSELCAGGEEGKDACTGDGGSPLVCQAASGRWTVVGLVAWGVGCAEPEVPGVYTRVSHFREWIDSTNP